MRCDVVNRMFLELTKGSISDDSAESLRETYGLYGNYEYINCEISLFEENPEPILERGKITLKISLGILQY